MCQAAARIRRSEHLQSIAAGFYEVDFSVFIDDKSHSVSNGGFGNEDAVFLRDMAVDKVAQQRECQSKTCCECFLRWTIVRANGENLRAIFLVLLHSRLERFHFSRSTTRKSSREEGQNDRAFTDVIGQMHRAAFG